MNTGALEGVKILDLTRVLAGPFCGMLLADMGAEVIKIEVPNKGDDSRFLPPFINGESAYYMNLNRNKQGITLNLKSPEGKQIFLDLVKKADVVIENFRPGVMKKLGLDHEELKKHNKKIILGSVSGFGGYGPYSKRAGYDIIGQAMGGLMSTTGWEGGPPTRTGTAISDVLGGMFLTIGVLSAYIKVQQSGEGQIVDVALVDSIVASLEIINQVYLATGEIPARIGNRYESVYPYDSFKAKDGDLVIGCGNDKLFKILAELMGKAELITDERFSNNGLRVKNHAALKPIIEEWLKDFTIEDGVNIMLEQGIPAAPINTIDKVVNDDHIAGAREMFVEVEHPIGGKTKITGNPIKFSVNKATIKHCSPLLGQDNEKILEKFLGLNKSQVAELKDKGII